MVACTYYRLHIAYDGTAYYGWQPQADTTTIAGVLQKTFYQTFGLSAVVVGASRTDAGVHAYDQVARCATVLSMDPERLRIVWNRALPTDIVIRSISVITDDFHPQRRVVSKTYWYHLAPQRMLPFAARYVWQLDYSLNIDTLTESLSYAVGTHDFRSFCTGTDYDTTVCRIDGIDVDWIERYRVWRVAVHGPKFLYKMVRRVVGGAVYIAMRKHLAPTYYYDVLHARNPEHSLITAPAHGLLLRKIRYNE